MSEPTLAQTLQIVVDAFVRKRVSSACLVASGIVVNRMGRGEVVEGYQIEDSLKGYGHHYWYRLDGVDYDIGTPICRRVVRLARPDAVWWVEGRTIRLSTRRPKGYTYWCDGDAEDRSQVKELESAFATYTTAPKKFWARSPRWMRELLRN